MTNKIALFFDLDYIVGVSNPIKAGYFPLKFNALDGSDRCYLYFKHQSGFSDFGLQYKNEFLNKKKGFYGNFIQLIENKIQIEYREHQHRAIYLLKTSGITQTIRELFDKNRTENNVYNQLELSICFSQNIKKEVREEISEFFKNDGFNVVINKYELTDLLSLDKTKIIKNKKYLLIEGLNSHLNISIFEKKENSHIKSLAFLPRDNSSSFNKKALEFLISKELEDNYTLNKKSVAKKIEILKENFDVWLNKLNSEEVCQIEIPLNNRVCEIIITKEKLNAERDLCLGSFVFLYLEPFFKDTGSYSNEIYEVIIWGNELDSPVLLTEIKEFFKRKISINYNKSEYIYKILEYFIRYSDTIIRDNNEINSLENEIEHLKTNGDFKEAIELYEKIELLIDSKENTETINLLSKIIKIQKDLENSLLKADFLYSKQLCTEALILLPDNEYFSKKLGKIQIETTKKNAEIIGNEADNLFSSKKIEFALLKYKEIYNLKKDDKTIKEKITLCESLILQFESKLNEAEKLVDTFSDNTQNINKSIKLLKEALQINNRDIANKKIYDYQTILEIVEKSDIFFHENNFAKSLDILKKIPIEYSSKNTIKKRIERIEKKLNKYQKIKLEAINLCKKTSNIEMLKLAISNFQQAKLLYPFDIEIEKELEKCYAIIIEIGNSFFQNKKYKDAIPYFNLITNNQECTDKANNCKIILKNLRQMNNLKIELNYLKNTNNIDRLKQRLGEIKELNQEILNIDSTNEESTNIYQSYSKSANDILPKEEGIFLITSNNENDIKSALDLFSKGCFIEAKKILKTLNSTAEIQEYISKCDELIKYERILKGIKAEYNSIEKNKNKQKAKQKIKELDDLKKEYAIQSISQKEINELIIEYTEIINYV